MRTPSFLFVLCSFCLLEGLAAGRVSAQQISPLASAGQIERSRLPNPALPVFGGQSAGEPTEGGGFLSPTAPATSGDSDLGVQSLLRRPERPEPWSLFADGGFVFTSNVALTHKHTRSDVFFVGEGGLNYDWKLSPDLSLSAAARDQYFAYKRFNQLDFGSLNFALAMSYTAHQLDDFILSAQLGFTRLTHRSVSDNEFYRNGNLSLGAEKVIPIGRAQVVSAGGDIELGLSVPHVAEREEFGLSTSYVVQVTRLISLQAGVRGAYYIYADTNRQDFNLSGNTGITFAFTPWCSAGGNLSGTIDRSNREVFAYDVLDTGVTVFFRLRF